MKIAYDYQTFTVQRYGGISRYFYQLTKHISNMGHNAEIFSPLYINNYITNLPKELVNGRFVGSKYIDRMPKKSRIIGGMNRSLSKRQLDLFNPDIVHETFYSKHKTYKKAKLLELKNISKKLGEFNLKDISFTVSEDDYFVLLGESGAGKSILLEIIAGLINADDGQLIKNNINISNHKIQHRNIIMEKARILIVEDEAIIAT